jgi:hypothetical protein
MMNVYFTVDTETSMGGAWRDPDRRPLTANEHIFCRIQGQDHGIGLITRMLSDYGFRATHFVETLMALVNGDREMGSVFDFLLKHDQDVQLHIHPTYRFYADACRARASNEAYEPPRMNDLLAEFDEDAQMDLIGEAASIFQRFAGRPPVAFRAGCFAANRLTLRCLRRVDIRIDSSFNPCYPQWSFRDDPLRPNEVRQIEGVWEVPVTVARTPLPEGYGGLKHADPTALSFGELRTMLENGEASGQRHFVLIFHSFSAVKARDDRSTRMRPDRLVIRRLRRLLAYLSHRGDLYRVSTFDELARQGPSAADEAPVIGLPLFAAGWRKSVQAVNRWYWI